MDGGRRFACQDASNPNTTQGLRNITMTRQFVYMQQLLYLELGICFFLVVRKMAFLYLGGVAGLVHAVTAVYSGGQKTVVYTHAQDCHRIN